MSEIIKKRLKNSEGKTVLIFLFNNFRYKGKITGCDDNYVEILEDRINSKINSKNHSYKIIALNQIKDCEVEE